MGLHAETVYRDKKHGKRVSLAELEKQQVKKKVQFCNTAPSAVIEASNLGALRSC